MPKPTGSSVKAARICNFQTEIATTVANLLRGHAVQADGFIARTSGAKGGSATVVALLQQTTFG